MGVRHNTPYRKCARIVGDVLGRYHPHGDAAVYEALRPRRPRTRYNLDQLAVRIPGAVHDARSVAPRVRPGKKVVLFATLHYWIEQAVMLGLTLICGIATTLSA